MNEQEKQRFTEQIEFLVEMDKMKNIYRQTRVLHEDRAENDAEHAWHLAMLAIVLSEYANEPVDLKTVLKTVLIHDIVEIDAGDTYAYDAAGNATKAEREQKAADRLFGMLPEDQGREMRQLWDAFEAGSTPEARFANSLDRIQPLMLNYCKHGESWRTHGTRREQVEKRIQRIFEGSQVLGDMAEELIRRAAEEGLLK
ncbi:MAG: HD domain-containing protein [Oscillospiraceae bacterium]|nr:HD domain-containing protein [Oscillospiraceae bacterium]MBQ5339056.1 HD domain-containing protein [Oscillospiraceae bacterium]